MRTIIAFAISQSILLPMLIGMARFKTVKLFYLPFFADLVLGFLTELVSFLLIKRLHSSNAVPTNIFVLAEWLLLLYQFNTWKLLRNKGVYFYMLAIGPILIWVIENLIFSKIYVFAPFFKMIYSLLIVLLSISEINFMITHDHKNLLKDSRFIICIGFILFFIYQIVYEWAYQLSLVEQTHFTELISGWFGYVNALANIIFGVAFLLIPVRRDFKLE